MAVKARGESPQRSHPFPFVLLLVILVSGCATPLSSAPAQRGSDSTGMVSSVKVALGDGSGQRVWIQVEGAANITITGNSGPPSTLPPAWEACGAGRWAVLRDGQARLTSAMFPTGIEWANESGESPQVGAMNQSFSAPAEAPPAPWLATATRASFDVTAGDVIVADLASWSNPANLYRPEMSIQATSPVLRELNASSVGFGCQVGLSSFQGTKAEAGYIGPAFARDAVDSMALRGNSQATFRVVTFPSPASQGECSIEFDLDGRQLKNDAWTAASGTPTGCVISYEGAGGQAGFKIVNLQGNGPKVTVFAWMNETDFILPVQ